MGTLVFVCPTTGHEVSTGVEIGDWALALARVRRCLGNKLKVALGCGAIDPNPISLSATLPDDPTRIQVKISVSTRTQPRAPSRRRH
jgi:hypothetical protein